MKEKQTPCKYFIKIIIIYKFLEKDKKLFFLYLLNNSSYQKTFLKKHTHTYKISENKMVVKFFTIPNK